MARWLFLLCYPLLVLASAEEKAYGSLFLGAFDLGRENQDSQYGIEYEFQRGVSEYELKPVVGVMRTRGASHYVYAGFNRTSPFSQSKAGLAFSISLTPGLYVYGGGEDTNLGHVFEFRSSAGLIWRFADDTRLGLHIAHLSNASVSDVNPGSELLTLTYGLPF